MLEMNPEILPDSKATNKYHVYYQPDNNITLSYPAIVYELSSSYDRRANNELYAHRDQYKIMIIDRNPDSEIPNRVRYIPYTRFQSRNRYDRLYHTAFITYF